VNQIAGALGIDITELFTTYTVTFMSNSKNRLNVCIRKIYLVLKSLKMIISNLKSNYRRN